MRTLRLVGLSADGSSVVFVDATGAEFAAPADERLRAALRNDRARLGQLEIEMESALRPRDIQARIRAGDSPETVATIAQVPVERIMAFCLPVLAEREHMADVARRSHVRRKTAEGPARPLAEVVSERLRGRGVDPSSAEWDSWRRDDGRWAVQVSYLSGERERVARFVFDSMGRYSLAEDDEAKWLTGERQQTRKGPMPRESGRPSERRLSAVPTGEDLLSLGDSDDELDPDGDDFDDELMQDYRSVDAGAADFDEDADDAEDAYDAADGDDLDDAPSTTDDLTAVVRALQQPADDADQGDATDVDDPEAEAEAEAEAETTEPDDGAPTPGRRPQDAPTEPTPDRKRKQRRASVPSWDEIMFGRDDT